MGPIGCPETLVRNYRHSLRNNPEERNSHLIRGGSLESRHDLCLQYDVFVTVCILKTFGLMKDFPVPTESVDVRLPYIYSIFRTRIFSLFMFMFC